MTRTAFGRWLARVLPPTEYMLGSLGLYILLASGLAWAEFKAGGPVPEFVGLHSAMTAILGLSWGVWRATAHHPALVLVYGDWLARSPWRPGLPLPAGPVAPTSADLAVLAALAALGAVRPGWPTVAGPLGALLGFALASAWVLILIESRAWMPVVVLALGAIETRRTPVGAVGLLLLAVAAAALGVHRAWRSFPWTESHFLKMLRAGAAPPLGWPFGALGPSEPPPRLAVWEAVLGAAILAAGAWVLAGVAPAGERLPLLRMALFWATLAMPGQILQQYVNGAAPPLSLAGRLATGRLLLRFDAVYLAVALVPAIGWGTLFLLAHFQMRPDLAATAALFALLMSAAILPPDLERFRLTTPCLLKPRRFKVKEEVQLM